MILSVGYVITEEVSDKSSVISFVVVKLQSFIQTGMRLECRESSQKQRIVL